MPCISPDGSIRPWLDSGPDSPEDEQGTFAEVARRLEQAEASMAAAAAIAGLAHQRVRYA